MSTIETERLLIRPMIEADRSRFIELFTDDKFTVFSGAHNIESANARFDQMLHLCSRIPYSKQPVIDRESNTIIGYTGVGAVELEGAERLEWGWRFTPAARGKGYATEATTALLAAADQEHDGELLCIVAIDNHASRRVADKVGFRWWRRFNWPDEPTTYNLFLRNLGAGGPALR